MRVLFVSSFLLFKETRFGGAKRLFYFKQALKKDAHLDCIYFDQCKEKEYFDSVSNDHESLVLNVKEPGVFQKIFYAPSNLKKINTDDLKKLELLLKFNKYDVVLMAFSPSLTLINVITKYQLCPMIYLEDDLLIEQYRKHFHTAKNLIIFSIKFFRFFQTKWFLKKNLKKVDKIICISKEEEQLINQYFPSVKTYIIKYGITIDEYPFLGPTLSVPKIGFIGNFLHAPNYTAILELLDSLYPSISRKINDLQIVIAGKNIPKAIIQKYKFDHRIQFMENPQDLSVFYKEISIFINPIISGRGLRTKLVECAAFGRPIISTKLGAEGLDDLRIFIAEDAGSMERHIRTLCENSELYYKTIEYNRNQIQNYYSTDSIKKQLWDILVNK